MEAETTGQRGYRCGSGHGRAKLTDAAVKEIRGSPSVPIKVLARQFAIGVSTVKKIRAGAIWRHVG